MSQLTCWRGPRPFERWSDATDPIELSPPRSWASLQRQMVCRPQHLRSPDGPRRPAQTRHFTRPPSPLGDSIRADQSVKACRSRSSSGLEHVAKTSSRRSAATSSSWPVMLGGRQRFTGARWGHRAPRYAVREPETSDRGARTQLFPGMSAGRKARTSVRVLPKGDRYSQHAIPARGNPCGVRLRPQCSAR